MKAPSSWHDDAQGRDAGHDDMQLHILNSIGGLLPTVEHKDHVYTFARAYAEAPCISGGSIIAFTDVLAKYTRDEPNPQLGPKATRTLTHRIHLEIKPKIYSAGACVRQAYALEHAIKKARTGDYWASDEIVIAVWADDPKLAVLRGISPFYVMPFKRSVVGDDAA